MEVTQVFTIRLMPSHDEAARSIAFLSQQIMSFNKTLSTDGNPLNLLHLRLALDEALLNAIEHGCRHTKEPLQLWVRISATILEISVEDPGNGFAYEQIKFQSGKDIEKTMTRGLRNSKGWGLAIIQSVCREIFWNRRGNRITMVFHA